MEDSESDGGGQNGGGRRGVGGEGRGMVGVEDGRSELGVPSVSASVRGGGTKDDHDWSGEWSFLDGGTSGWWVRMLED